MPSAEVSRAEHQEGLFWSYSNVDGALVRTRACAVQAMAMDYTKTNPSLVEGWLKASKAAYALPAVTLTYDKDIDEYTTWDYLDLNEDGNVGSGEHQFNTARADDDQGIGVRLAWRLDKLVMSSERIRVINEAQDIVKLRDKVLDEVTRVYFDRRRLQVDQLLNPSSSLRDRIKHELRSRTDSQHRCPHGRCVLHGVNRVVDGWGPTRGPCAARTRHDSHPRPGSHTQLIARRIREQGVYCEIKRARGTRNEYGEHEELILSGGPHRLS